MPKIKVLFVCLGNICRSPLAEAIFNQKVHERNWNVFIEADSCGTSNYHVGSQPDERTILNALKNGVSIHHKARQFNVEDFNQFDYILVMDQSNFRDVQRIGGGDHQKVKLMRSFDIVAGDEVPDPYYGGEQGFQKVFEILERSTEGLLNFLESKIDTGIR